MAKHPSINVVAINGFGKYDDFGVQIERDLKRSCTGQCEGFALTGDQWEQQELWLGRPGQAIRGMGTNLC